MKNILIPTDFSENSWNSIKYGLEYFKNTPCNFYLLHVTLHSYLVETDVPMVSATVQIQETLLAKDKLKLKNVLNEVKKISANKDHHFKTLLSTNFFIDSVKHHIQKYNIDLIIMGTKGASGIKKVIIGSNTADLITQIKCPVLIVPENATYSSPKEIAFPTDYNILYKPQYLNAILELAKAHNSSIRILHVNKKEEELTEFQKENKKLLHNFFSNENHSFHMVTNKNISKGIQCFTESRDIDIIVMIAKNINLFQRILFNPKVEEISYHTDIPFLVLHE